MSILLALTLALAPPPVCDPEATGRSWTPAQKAETRARVRRACKAVGGSDLYCDFWRAALMRESWGGVASAVCTHGRDADGDAEYGLGPLCLSVKWAGDKLPGASPDPAFCLPEAAFAVGHAIAIRAVDVYGADDAVELQAVFGGGTGAYGCEDTIPAWWSSVPGLAWVRERFNRHTCRTAPKLRHVHSVCKRMAGCREKLSRADLGRALAPAERWPWAQRMADSWSE